MCNRVVGAENCSELSKVYTITNYLESIETEFKDRSGDTRNRRNPKPTRPDYTVYTTEKPTVSKGVIEQVEIALWGGLAQLVH